MAISIDYITKVISVPRNDMTLLQASPVEVRELNINTFWLLLKDWEDGDAGMVMPTTHVRNPAVSVGGVELAPVLLLINGYTVTFEDGQYAVNLTGANSNIADNVNVNQVSVRSTNSAGLVQTREIEYASFGGGVWVDVVGGAAGTSYPNGTRQSPVGNLGDAMLIASLRGFNTIYVIGDVTVDSGASYVGMTFIGESKNRSHIFVSSAANVAQCEFYECHLQGTLDGDCVVRDCLISDLNYISGFIEECVLNPGTISLGGTETAHFLDCWSGVPGQGTPTIDCAGDGPALALRNYNGGIRLINKTGSASASIDLNAGQVVLESTVTAGNVIVRGVGKLTNNATGTAIVDSNYLVQGTMSLAQQQALSEAFLDMDDTIESGLTVRGAFRLLAAALAGKVSGAAGSQVTFRNALADSKDRIVATVDPDGNRTAITVDTTD